MKRPFAAKKAGDRWNCLAHALAVLAAAAFASVSYAQTDAQLASSIGPRGIVPTGNYSISNIEAIDNVYGTVSYNIPLANLPSGRAGMSVGVPLIYNSNLWNMQFGTSNNGVTSADLVFDQAGGWNYGYEYGLNLNFSPAFYQSTSATPNCNLYVNYEFYQLSAVFPDGSQHVLRLYGGIDDAASGFYQELPGISPPPCQSHSQQSGDFTYYTVDGTYVKLVISANVGTQCSGYQWRGNFGGCWATHPWTMYFPDGRQVTGYGPQATAIADRNGNTVTLTNVEDIAVPTGTGAGTLVQDNLPSPRQINLVRVLGSNPTTEDTITENGANGSTLTWTVSWALENLNTPIVYGGCLYQLNSLSPTVWSCAPPSPILAVTQISLPVNAAGYIPTYKFGYDLTGWGQLNSVTLPAGASVAYTYFSNAQTCNGPGCSNPIGLSPPRNPVSTKTVTYCNETDQATPTQPGASCQTTATPYLWNYSFIGTTGSTVQGPDGGSTTTLFYDYSLAVPPATPSWKAGLVYQTQQPDGSTTISSWQQNTPYSNTTGINGIDASPGDPVVAGTARCVGPCGTSSQFAATLPYYDRNGNTVKQCDYDWGTYNATIPANPGGNVCPSYSGTLLRTTNRVFAMPTSSVAGAGNDDTNGYWNPSTNPESGRNSPVALKLPVCLAVTGSGNGSVSQLQYDSGGAITTGNLTQEADWDSTKSGTQPLCSGTLTSSNAVVQTWTYTSHGNLLSEHDGNNNATAYAYDSNDLYLTGITAPLGRATTYSFDAATGLLNSQGDYNGLTRNYTYDNPGRQVLLAETGGSGLLRKTATSYEDANRRVITHADNATPNDQQLVSVTDFDQLGRVRLTRQLESASQSAEDDTAGIKVQTRYGYSNPLSYQIVSNPYRAGTSGNATAANGDPNMGWTVTTSDWSHRLSGATAYGGSAPPSPLVITGCPTSGSQVTCYSGNTATVSDEASVTRVNTVDGLGRLITVVENGISATTTNVYDVLGNLTGVTHAGYVTNCTTPQGGSANRSFFYDSLGRLGTACNPESGNTTYTYDNDSNLKTRTDARSRASRFVYDALNRLTDKAYSDATPGVHYQYPNGQDFLASVASSASTYTYSNYDAMARPGAGSQTTGAQTFAFPSLLWTPRGQVSSITYPSGRVVTTTYDVAGRISGVNGSLNGTSTPYVSGTSYAAHGGLAGMSMGDGLSRSFTYNQRLQTTQVSAGSLMTLGLNWGSVQNNGTLQQQTITRPGLGVTQTYGYDGVSRLNSASEPGNFSQSYVYDNVGNRAVTGNSSLVLPNYTPQTSLSSPPPPGSSANWPFDPATNHWAAPAASYDLAGNTTGLRTQSMGYDAESRMTSWSDSSISPATTVLFSYDGDGRRVMKTGGTSGTTTYVYDPAGNLALEAGGVAAVAATSYLTADHLGSTRLVTNGSGGCVGAHDFLPFGEAIPGTWGRGAVPCYPAMDTQTDTTWKFGGQERDTETGFDNFLARHMAGPQGRFLSVDPGSAGGVSGDPQSWNGYAYAGNSPLVNIDPSGECTVVNGQYVPDSGNPCPASTGTSITVIEAGPDDLLLLAVKLFAASLEVLQKTQELAAPLVNIVNDFRHSSSCTDSLVGIGQVAGGAALGGYSAVAGFAAGGFLGSPSGPGAAATAVGGAALFGGLGTMAGARAGGGIGGVAAGIFCSKGTSTGGDEYRDKTRGANSRDAKIIRDVAREAGVNAREFGDYVEDMKPGYGHGPSDNFSYKQLLDLADQYKRAGGK